jgi:mannitol/fructose-specific phosphotransferase system IIA component (Ntr-type)
VHLVDFLSPHDVVFGLRASNIAAAAEQLLEQTLPLRGFLPSDVQRLVGAVTAREHEAPTQCGTIAIPHARDSQLQSFVIAIGINPDGVVESIPMLRVIFAFLSPEPRREEHLALLAALARLSRDQAAVDAIATASQPQTVLDVIRTRSE